MQYCMGMEWGDLRVFLAIARVGTLGAAARALGQTQPTMGRRLRALETAVGQTLFLRTAEGFVLTEAGQAVLGHAERMEEEALGFERTLAGEHALEGLLRVSSSDWFGRIMLAPVLAELGRQHPKLAVELLTDARPYSLPRREADCVFRIMRFDEPEVISRKLVTIPYALYGRKGAARTRVVTMDTAFAEMPDAKWLRRVLPDAVIAFRSNSRDVQAELCARGAGLAVLPKPLGARTAGLVEIDVGEAPPSRDTFVGYHRDLSRLARLRVFLDLVAATISA